MSMKLYHFSPKRIKKLDPECSMGRWKCVWFCTEKNQDWAFLHVASAKGTIKLYRHQCTIERRNLRKWREGIYLSFEMVEVEECVPMHILPAKPAKKREGETNEDEQEV